MKTKTRSRVKATSKTVVALATAGLVLASAAAGYTAVGERQEALMRQAAALPYQTVGYMPGYVPGYIPGRVPGYGVPGYIPGYGTFKQLTPEQFQAQLKQWLWRWKNLF